VEQVTNEGYLHVFLKTNSRNCDRRLRVVQALSAVLTLVNEVVVEKVKFI
jgi:hypothetical protein